jgi:hypothetical protein
MNLGGPPGIAVAYLTAGYRSSDEFGDLLHDCVPECFDSV